MADEINIEVVDEGSTDDPFSVTGASAPASTTASAAPDATGQVDGADEVDQTDDELANVDFTDPNADEEDDEALTEEEQVALDELRNFMLGEAERTIVPKLTSTYDRKLAAQDKQLKELQTQAQQREQQLLAQVREAQLNGLPDAEKQRLTEAWASEDRISALDAREKELTGYHTELLRAAYAQEYANFGVTADDLEEYSSPEEMDEFIREVQLEYYKQLAETRQSAPPAAPATAASAKPTPARKAPAGVNAPADGGAGGAVPEVKGFNSTPGRQAMIDNLRNSEWETAQIV